MVVLLQFRPELRHRLYGLIVFSLCFLIALFVLTHYAQLSANSLLAILTLYFAMAFSVFIYLQVKAATTIYELTDRELIEKKGIIFKQIRILPTINIDNVGAKKKDFIDVIFNFTTVYIDSPGGPAHEVTIDRVNADTVAKFIGLLEREIEHLQKVKPEGKIST